VRPVTVARSYAEALLELALKDADTEAYARAIRDVAEWLRREPKLRRFLETPRVRISEKKEVLRRALEDSVPERFLRFLYVVLDKGRQRLLPEIAQQFGLLLDQQVGRVPAEITLALEPDRTLRERLVAEIEKWEGREVVPQVRIDPDILGGVIVRVRDRLIDASLRRRLLGLRRSLLQSYRAAASA
jgi:F-type H+-transporting ATPase subunit delta